MWRRVIGAYWYYIVLSFITITASQLTLLDLFNQTRILRILLYVYCISYIYSYIGDYIGMCLCACMWRIRRWNCGSSYGGYAWKPFFRFHRPDLCPCLLRCVSGKISIDVKLVSLTRHLIHQKFNFAREIFQQKLPAVFIRVFRWIRSKIPPFCSQFSCQFFNHLFSKFLNQFFSRPFSEPFHQISFQSLHFSRRHQPVENTCAKEAIPQWYEICLLKRGKSYTVSI